MAAALQAAWKEADVTLFEHNAEVGRKLLVTGSGRCNITNAAATAEKYTCADSAWMAALLNQFGVKNLVDMLLEIGIPVRATFDGWYYPLSESAHTVVAAFSSALATSGVKLNLSTQVVSVATDGDRFMVGFSRDNNKNYSEFDRLIVSAGGKAYPTLGSRGELFPVLETLGHSVHPKRPALAPVLADLGRLKSLQGVRLDAGVTLWEGARQLASAQGNLIFTQWGLNGPAVMDISHHVSACPNANLELSLNVLAFFQDEFDSLLAQHRTASLPVRVLLGAFLPPKATALYLKNARLNGDAPLGEVEDGALQELINQLNDTRVAVKGVRGFEFCQVSAGGVPVGEVDALTLESRLVKGLYLTGETLDVVGPCGGYNLQYAFSSGALAGRAAAG